MSPWNRVCLTVALTTCACGPDPIDYPSPPEEARAILATYEKPTGTVDAADAALIAARASERIDALDIDWLPEVMSRALVRLRERFEVGGLPLDPAATVDPDRPTIIALVDLEQVCSGWSVPPGPPNEAENGSIQLFAKVDNTRLRRELWGTASNCRSRISPSTRFAQVVTSPALNVTLNGSLLLSLYAPLPEEEADAAFFMSFEGELGREGQLRPLSFDFRAINSQIEIREAVDDGEVIIGRGLGTVSVRGQNASYTCDLATLSCN